MTVREWRVESESESGSSVFCRLAGFGHAAFTLAVVPPFSQGIVRVMIVEEVFVGRETL